LEDRRDHRLIQFGPTKSAPSAHFNATSTSTQAAALELKVDRTSTQNTRETAHRTWTQTTALQLKKQRTSTQTLPHFRSRIAALRYKKNRTGTQGRIDSSKSLQRGLVGWAR